MFGVARWSMRRKVAAAATLALLLLAPLGITQQSQTVVTGHSTFYDGAGFDKCLASIAGIMKTDVMWFNDQVLVERYGGKGTYVYITENGSADPTVANSNNALYTDGTVYDFTDPNGVAWHVDEAMMGNLGGPTIRNADGSPNTHPSLVDDPTYVWIVEMSAFPIHDQFAGNPTDPNYHDLYNFLDIVDTCKFDHSAATHVGPVTPNQAGNGFDYNITHTGTEDGHPSGTGTHTHQQFLADIWIGTKPTLIPVSANGVPGTAQYESNWATDPNTAQSTGHAPQTYANSTTGQDVPGAPP